MASSIARWLCINAKEAENVALSREVIAMIPEFLDRPGVLGIGEIGLNKNTRNEATVFLEHLDLAARHRGARPGAHAPPGRQVPGDADDPGHGARPFADQPERVCIDHVEEHTIRLALDAGHWVGMTLYPITKCTPARAADMVEMYGTERIMVNSAGDWGHSDPAGGAGVHLRDAPPGPRRGPDSQGRLRQSAGVLLAVRAFPVLGERSGTGAE